jgi:hypothetical protein
MQEERRWGWMAAALALAALVTATACALDGVWVPAGLFAFIGLGMADVAWIRLRGDRGQGPRRG